IHAVERTLEHTEGGTEVSDEEMFGGFDKKQMEEYREEASTRWGKEVVDQSYRRVAKFSKEDWARIGVESQAINEGMTELMGSDPGAAPAQELIGRWFKLINDNYYDCSPEIFRGLGDGYVSDSRFTAFYDKYRPGLAEFMRAAMHVFADRLEAQR
ncbi:MAG: TipAS antibiotic-recognition domain-containing protein, partial [Chloroflexota bacterium]